MIGIILLLVVSFGSVSTNPKLKLEYLVQD
jgi:hypothetical protein